MPAWHIRAGHREQAPAAMIAGVLIPHGEPLAGLLSPFLTRRPLAPRSHSCGRRNG